METELNKKAVRTLYEHILNTRKFDDLEKVVSPDYLNAQGDKGIDGFAKSVMVFAHAFPDATWTIKEIIAEGNKVFVKHKVEGTHRGVFQNIAPTQKHIEGEGMAIYKLKARKIISHQVITNQLSFLQQLNVIHHTLWAPSSERVYFVDRFTMPQSSVQEFTEKMEVNRRLIRKLPGFIQDQILVREDNDGRTVILTIAAWDNQASLDNAKKIVQDEYKKSGFHPQEFYRKLHIQMERETFRYLIDLPPLDWDSTAFESCRNIPQTPAQG